MGEDTRTVGDILTGQPGETPAASRAPSLPIEAPLVRAVRDLEGLKVQVDTLLFLLERCPDDASAITSTVNAAIARANGASAAVWQFQQIRSCEGQG